MIFAPPIISDMAQMYIPKRIKGKPITGYAVEVRRRRKFRVESPFALPKSEALEFGIQRTLGSAAATFRLIPTTGRVGTLGLEGPSAKQMQYFRTPRTRIPQALTFVQKERQRIVSAGEKREISFAGIRAAAARTRIPKPKPATTFKKIRSNNKFIKGKTNIRMNIKGGRQKWF